MNFTPEIEIFYMLSIFSMTSLKKHMKYCIIMFGKCLIVLAHLMSKFVRSCVALTRSSSGIHRSLSEMGRRPVPPPPLALRPLGASGCSTASSSCILRSPFTVLLILLHPRGRSFVQRPSTRRRAVGGQAVQRRWTDQFSPTLAWRTDGRTDGRRRGELMNGFA